MSMGNRITLKFFIKGSEMNTNTYLFDFDGTLVDSMPTYGAAMVSVLDDFNIKYGDDIIKIVTPLGFVGTAKYYQTLGLDKPLEDIIYLMRKKLVHEYTYNIQAKDTVQSTLEQLKKQGCSLNILTASPHLTLDPCLKRLGIFDLFDNVWSCEDFGTVKSDPNIYKMAAQKLKREVFEVIFLDDNYFAVKTAKEAGMISVGVYDDSSKDYVEQMKEVTDSYIYKFDELL